MKLRTAVAAILLLFVAASVVYLVIREPGPEPPRGGAERSAGAGQGGASAEPPHKVIAYYFHSTVRCKTCLAIESLAESTLAEAFPAERRDGTLEWQSVNIEEQGNEHFAKDYELAASSLVLVDFENGRQKSWKNLASVWELVYDPKAFGSYVRQEASALLGKPSNG